MAACGGTPFEFSESFGLRMLQCVHNPWCVWTENRCCGEGELLTGAFLGFPCCLLAPFYHRSPYVLGMMHSLIVVHVSWEEKPSGSLPTLPVPVPTDPFSSPSLSAQGKQLWLKRGPLCLGA